MESPQPTRITIDFRADAHPAAGWILGRLADSRERLDILRLAQAEPRETMPAPAPYDAADCACPEWCERDHANE